MAVENLVPPGLDPQVFQHIASCYIDYTIPAFPLCNVKYSGSIHLFITSHLVTYHGNGKSHIHNTSSGNLQLDITNIRLKGIYNNYSNNLHKSTLYKILKDFIR
jgi:hypothetical protein